MPSISHLNHLEADGLLTLSQVNPELVYLFRHALVQEAAYQSLVRVDRKALHLAVGEILEDLYRETPEEHAALLAYHFVRGGDESRALHYYKAAAEDASGHDQLALLLNDMASFVHSMPEESTMRAREIIDGIIASAGNSGFGEKFLSQRAVQEIYPRASTIYNGLDGKDQ